MIVLDTAQKWLPMKDAVREVGMDYRKFLRFIDVYKIARRTNRKDHRITEVDMEAVRAKLKRQEILVVDDAG